MRLPTRCPGGVLLVSCLAVCSPPDESGDASRDGDVPHGDGVVPDDGDADVRPPDDGGGDAYCPDGITCLADFPCSVGGSEFRTRCAGDAILRPQDVPCERMCGTPCCGGGGCEMVSEPCGPGRTCTEDPSWGRVWCVPACYEIDSFADVPLTWGPPISVSPYGEDSTADGSHARPYRTLAASARTAGPGDWILLEPGTYAGDNWIDGLRGTAESPILITGTPGDVSIISGGSEAVHLVDPHYVVIRDLTIAGQTANGINIDDGGDYSTPAEHVVIQRVRFQNVGSGGNNDCLKLSGVDEFFVLDGEFESCGAGGNSGSGIDMVGCHDGIIARNEFREMGGNAVQAKGGSARVTIARNLVENGGARAFNLGGSTGMPYFRPLGADYEARDIRAVANVVVGSEAAIAFVGCDGCLAANNTIVHPATWVLRVLQESVAGFVPCRNGRFVNNAVVFSTSDVSVLVNVGPDTAPETFTFSNNLWYADDDPSFTAPDLPVPESNTVVGDPLFVGAAAGDFHLAAGSPADGAGAAPAEVTGDFDGVCYGSPPTIGAFEGP